MWSRVSPQVFAQRPGAYRDGVLNHPSHSGPIPCDNYAVKAASKLSRMTRRPEVIAVCLKVKLLMRPARATIRETNRIPHPISEAYNAIHCSSPPKLIEVCLPEGGRGEEGNVCPRLLRASDVCDCCSSATSAPTFLQNLERARQTPLLES
jgi:hypothetical protein